MIVIEFISLLSMLLLLYIVSLFLPTCPDSCASMFAAYQSNIMAVSTQVTFNTHQWLCLY